MHFSLSLFTKEKPTDHDVMELMHPFDENLECAPRIEYTYRQAVDEIRSWKSVDSSNWTDEQCFKYLAEDYAPKLIDENKNLLTNSNPNGKYDYFEIGGRWWGSLHAAAGEYGGIHHGEYPKNSYQYNIARIRDIDFSVNQTQKAQAEREWDILVRGETPTKEEAKRIEDTGLDMYSRYSFIDIYGTKEHYAILNSTLWTNSVLWVDGTWDCKDNYKSRMEWYAKYLEYIQKANPDWYLTIIDCHY